MKAEYFESAELSDLGRKRKNNEDVCLRIPERGIYCVADGMGGQAGGDLASEAITTALQEVFAKAGPEEDDTLSRRIMLFTKAANQASKWIKNFSDEKVIGQMGSTLVALVIDPRNPARAVGLHAGDSRLYRFRQSALKLLTSDHSAVAALAAKLGRDPASIPAKYQNELLRCVGLNETVELEKTPVDVLSGDLFLICSDGLTRMLPDETIAKILKRGAQDPISTVAQTLINEANEAGGKDNITVVLVKVGDISGVPNTIDPEGEEEFKTPAAPVSPSGAEAQTPLSNPDGSSGIPDDADAYRGDTPRTDDLTPDKTPSTAQPRKGSSDVLGETKETGKNKKIPPLGIAIVIAVITAVGAGSWLIVNSTTHKSGVVAVAKLKNEAQARQQENIAVQAERDRKYQAAMDAGQKAYALKDYDKAIKQADAALAIKSPDEAATKLKNEAQARQHENIAAWAERDRKYQAAMAAGQKAYALKDYDTAIKQADAALAIKSPDEAATKLKNEAQARQQEIIAAQAERDREYQAALAAGQKAYALKDYDTAIKQAEVALANMPGDVTATKLQENARRLAAVEDMNRKYQAALQEGQAAMKNNNYVLAAAKAKEALAIRPSDPAATQLAGQIQEPLDLEKARNGFDQGDYEAVAKLCKAYPTDEAFAHLAWSNRVEQTALSDAMKLFNNGDYSTLRSIRLERQPYGHKTPFVELLNRPERSGKCSTN